MKVMWINIFLFFLLICFIFIILFFDLAFLMDEDGVVEYLSVVFWGVGLIFSIFLTIKKKYKFIPFVFLFVCFISLGEEISWGQRIFNIEVPESIANANKQSELNFHNLYILSGGSTWSHFFKTGEFDYRQIIDAQNLFRIGFVIFFAFFPLMTKFNFGAKILFSIGYYKPEKYFTLFIWSFIVFTFYIKIGKTSEYVNDMQEIREMSYALFIAMYLFGMFYSEKIKGIYNGLKI